MGKPYKVMLVQINMVLGSGKVVLESRTNKNLERNKKSELTNNTRLLLKQILTKLEE